jgi:hypothetical protein
VICRANPLTSTSSPSPDSGTHAAATVGVSDPEPFGNLPPHGSSGMRPDRLERRLRQRLDALGLAPRAELMSPSSPTARLPRQRTSAPGATD